MKKSRFKFTIANRISLGYVVVITVALITSTTCILSLQSNKTIDKEISNVHLPIMDAAKELRYNISESRKLTNNWIYLPSAQEKKALNELITTQYPLVNEKIGKILSDPNVDDSTRLFMKRSLATFDNVLIAEKKVMEYLNNDDAYGSDSIIDLAIKSYDGEIKNKAQSLETGIEAFITKENAYLRDMQLSKERSYSILSIMMAITVILILVVSIGASYYSTKSITGPLDSLKKIILALGKGEMAAVDEKLNGREDEVGEMSNAIDSMIKGLVTKTEFADQIGAGNYDKDFHLLGENDKMGSALIEMRDNLKKNAEENRRRNWSTTGMAQIGDILRRTDISASELYNEVIKYIVKYSGANQAGLFIIKDEEEGVKAKELQLMACYAYERKKFIEKTVQIGEGLVGQCVLEKDKIVLTEVPQGYVSVTSGLGNAAPRFLLIMPLKLNENVHGVLELASFKVFEEYEIEFIEKIAESIASIVSTIKINEKTKQLLTESQVQGEQLRSQEEEMRQNMEELQATQEEVQRKETSYIEEVASLKQKLQAYEGVVA